MFADQLEIVLPELRAYVRMLCGDAVQADDIVQSACEKAWKNRASFDESKGALRAWVFRIARNAALNTHGGFGFAAEYDIERKLRETRLYQVAPVNNNLVLAFVAEKCLGLPKSY